MFTFLSKDKPARIDKRTLKTINDEVILFLQARDVQSFKVYTLDYENNPIVLIQAEPQKKLRFSNILEIQIKRHLREKLGYQVPAIFWRFKTDSSENPGPEQADYEFEERPEYPQDLPTGEPTLASSNSIIKPEANPGDVSDNQNEHYDVRHLARKGMEVEEITMGEFDDFLKGTSTGTPNPQ
ncbi:MAG: hypothetical protein Q7U63_11755 [Polaromonas sp.]|uniref:hypothetical protein n=1 Tax=Polaromonas sp. TaxID=1869339 RepID=UPI00271E1DE7|nr:hypothetical protein [Polaromonas sp.]MDO9114453.1 hypothetical protein [Polaromonas sp.]MDP1704778.1 hypothetical protein [Sulfurimicrobium sp.]MDP2196979.1 hypothetical protein [Sulfurimicrobium sp.]MDZ7655062.1 hypothetical protein [Sulfurimicrobium sp.]